ncbi:MAG: tRNA-intron lyase [Crenarchaeota archaeon]|nr:tRNA-intron lyase [Thermoproteota archaeon]
MKRFHGLLVGLRVVILNPREAYELYNSGFYGKPLGIPKPKPGERFEAPLELDLVEACYLAEKGLLEVEDPEGRLISAEELARRAEEAMPRFRMLYPVYRDLREAGLVVRSGMKFGSDFSVYTKGPGLEHAPYLVQVIGYREEINPLDLVRAGRLSHSVRKRLLIAAIDEETNRITYIMLKWSKP